MDLDDIFKPIVLVTGFGPFLGHPVNASWESVKLLDRAGIERRHKVELVTIELPVNYGNVDEFVPALWDTHTPELLIHVGVSSIAKELTIETIAHRKGYKKMDYLNQCPNDHVCTAGGTSGSMRIKTALDVDQLCKDFNDGLPVDGINAITSCDAGRYLCEYTYYTSLSIDPSKTLFVHVPDTNVYPHEKSALGLEKILDLCLDQIRQADKANTKEIETNKI